MELSKTDTYANEWQKQNTEIVIIKNKIVSTGVGNW